MGELRGVARLGDHVRLPRWNAVTSSADTSNYTDKVFFVGHQANGPYNAVMRAVGQIRVTTAGRYTSSYTPCNGFATH